jgi:hypothetical protein
LALIATFSPALYKATGQWRTEKFKGNELIQTTFGSTYDQAMLQTTMSGLEADEPQ